MVIFASPVSQPLSVRPVRTAVNAALYIKDGKRPEALTLFEKRRAGGSMYGAVNYKDGGTRLLTEMKGWDEYRHLPPPPPVRTRRQNASRGDAGVHVLG